MINDSNQREVAREKKAILNQGVCVKLFKGRQKGNVSFQSSKRLKSEIKNSDPVRVLQRLRHFLYRELDENIDSKLMSLR